MNEQNFNKPPLTVGSLMRSMMSPDYPPHIVRLLEQVKSWLPQTFQLDGLDMPYWEVMRQAPETLFEQLSWLEKTVALLPSSTPPGDFAEAVVLSLGEVDLTGAMRLAVDYSLIFSHNVCRRVWIVADTWIYCDVAEYADHLRAMRDGGVSVRFMLVTPWGGLEIPISSFSSSNFSGPADDGRGRNRRRKDD